MVMITGKRQVRVLIVAVCVLDLSDSQYTNQEKCVYFQVPYYYNRNNQQSILSLLLLLLNK